MNIMMPYTISQHLDAEGYYIMVKKYREDDLHYDSLFSLDHQGFFPHDNIGKNNIVGVDEL